MQGIWLLILFSLFFVCLFVVLESSRFNAIPQSYGLLNKTPALDVGHFLKSGWTMVWQDAPLDTIVE